MTTKIVNSIKAVVVFSIAIFSIIACEKDFEDVGVNLIDNNLFDTKDSIFEVITFNKNIETSRVDGVTGLQYLLGVYNDPDFGLINTTFVSQLGLPVDGLDFGLNPEIDTVIFDIPYYVTDTNTIGNSPDFTLDSIIGKQSVEYLIKVSRLATFLNTLDPTDPTKVKTYYSNEAYTSESELYSGNFKPERNDTILYVKRELVLIEDEDGNTTHDVDTIKKTDLRPSIKLALDESEIKNIFINNINDADTDSFENFINYFRGIMIEAIGAEGSLMSLQMSDATINIYYTNEIITDETVDKKDLNGDGDADDTEVHVKTKQTKALTLAGVRANNYNRDYSSANANSTFVNPDSIMGEEKLFVQGAAGSDVEFKLFEGIDLDEIRNQNWLINGAILDVYVDNTNDNTNVPKQLFLYNADNNSVVLDVISEAQVNGIGGFLERDEDSNEPIKYQFSITDYISEILKSDSTIEVAKLAIKAYHPTDAPTTFTDTIVRDFSWNPKHVVLKGNKLPLVGGELDNTRFKLKIYYTTDNN